MAASIHGHEVMKLVHEADPPLDRDRLRQAINYRYGPDARFHACVAQDMSLDDLLAFLAGRGKVVEADGVLRTDIDLMCNHE
jgi:probable metal-binding protein